MSDARICPGVTEYLYHAAWTASVYRDGTWIAPSAFTPRCSKSEVRPIAGIWTQTGAERRSDSGWARPNPTVPGAAAAQKKMSGAPPGRARRARGLPGGGAGGAWALSRQYMTTRNPAIRRPCG